jgi:crotonobetainyl-CoA:carnitine CoA-transferase CaiB-like acyl-CoA transferase
VLEGLKVVELATYIAAPGAGGILADWGAEVVKIEPLTGDPIRLFFSNVTDTQFDDNPVFELDNRGKRAIAIDTSTAEGAELVRSLVKGADVFLTNVRPGGLERAGLDYTSLAKLNPRLIYTSVSGYGLEGEERDRPGFDVAAFWARSGVARLMAPKGTDPFPLRTAFGDHVTSLATVSGILAALHETSRTGRGRLVETSLLRTGIYSMGSDMAIQLRYGKLASTRPREQAINPLSNFFKTRDEAWIVVLTRQEGRDWKGIARAIGQPELASDARFASGRNRRENRAELIRTLDKAFAERDLAEWRVRLDAEDLVWAPVQTAAEVVQDKQAIASGAFVDMPLASGERARSPAAPVRFHGASDAPRTPAPSVGQHTDEILQTLGLGKEEIAALREKKVVG